MAETVGSGVEFDLLIRSLALGGVERPRGDGIHAARVPALGECQAVMNISVVFCRLGNLHISFYLRELSHESFEVFLSSGRSWGNGGSDSVSGPQLLAAGLGV